VTSPTDDRTPIEFENAQAAIREGIERARALVDEYGRVIRTDGPEIEPPPHPPNPA
jgi:hypothetical protein